MLSRVAGDRSECMRLIYSFNIAFHLFVSCSYALSTLESMSSSLGIDVWRVWIYSLASMCFGENGFDSLQKVLDIDHIRSTSMRLNSHRLEPSLSHTHIATWYPQYTKHRVCVASLLHSLVRAGISRILVQSKLPTLLNQEGEKRGASRAVTRPTTVPSLPPSSAATTIPNIVNEMNASRYIYVRENGIEWNSPSMQPAKGTCCGQSCTELAVMDNITVLYFDDINFDDVRNDTRCCNTCMTFCCGGRGEQVQIESTFCFSCCIRGRDNRTCIPVCCPDLCCPCIVKSELWVEDAPAAVKIIRDARDDAKRRLGLDD